MNSGNITYLNLRELAHEDYVITDGQADITGWPVVDESQTPVGKVRDLLFDPEQNAVRYIIVDLNDQHTAIEDKAILIPIGFANLGEDKKEVVIPVLHEDQYNAMPRYIIGEVTRDTEMQIRSAIGSPAALRIEEEIHELDPADFYAHHHFDRGNVISRRQETSPSGVISDAAIENREEERHTIHQLIEHAEENKVEQDELKTAAVSEHADFTVTAGQGIYTISPQENGTYRIFQGENKIGVIYAEPGHEGTKWRTMDHLDENLVSSLGQSIAAHNGSNTGK